MTEKTIDVLDSTTKTEIKKAIYLKPCVEHTHIFVLAFHHARNKLTAIVYKEKSSPIGGYTYDAKFGQYYVECAEHLDLGVIPISFSIRIDKISRWECRIPLPESVIKKFLDADQIAKLNSFKEKNRDCRFEFMQLVSCYVV